MKCAIEWIVNNSVTANFYHRAGLESKGFSFSDQEHFNKIYTVRLTINSSISVNDTDLHCNVFFEGTMVHDRVTSNHAKLFVITGECC